MRKIAFFVFSCIFVLSLGCAKEGGLKEEVEEIAPEEEVEIAPEVLTPEAEAPPEMAAIEIVKKDPSKTYLSDLIPESAPPDGEYLKDINPENNLIHLQGVRYEKGLCVNSTSEITYNLDGKYELFESVIGNDYPEYEGHIIFTVLVDGEKVYESKTMEATDTEKISIPVKGAKKLKLIVKDDGTSSPYVAWADAALK